MSVESGDVGPPRAWASNLLIPSAPMPFLSPGFLGEASSLLWVVVILEGSHNQTSAASCHVASAPGPVGADAPAQLGMMIGAEGGPEHR